MHERRRHQRGRVYYGGRVAFNERKSSMDCIVRNFSTGGARIEFANAALLPAEIDLTIERKGLAFLAQLVWRRQNEAGVRFRDPRNLNGAIPLDRATDRANKALKTRLEELLSAR